MKLYLAAWYTSNFHIGSTAYNLLNDREKEVYHSIPHFLESYHYIGKGPQAGRMRKDGVKGFIDSGAFSSFAQGIEVDVNAYCRWLRENMDLVEFVDGSMLASVLDAIGDPVETWRNQKRMEEQGFRVLPCFHYGEPIEVLYHYMENYEYITVGGMVPITTPQLRLWLDQIWGQHLTNRDGTAKVKVHGFGLTVVDLMRRYPWYSVDSSSWQKYGSMGWMFTPKFGAIQVSEHSSTRKDAMKHFDTLPPVMQEGLLDEVEKRGFDIERLRTSYATRWIYNSLSYLELMASSASSTFRLQQPVLF